MRLHGNQEGNHKYPVSPFCCRHLIALHLSVPFEFRRGHRIGFGQRKVSGRDLVLLCESSGGLCKSPECDGTLVSRAPQGLRQHLPLSLAVFAGHE